MRRIEAAVFERMEAVFARCPELFRFSVRDRSGLPDHIDPTTLVGELFIFEIARRAWASCSTTRSTARSLLRSREPCRPGPKPRICYAGKPSSATCTERAH